jgi:hypothetical protein
MPSPPTLRTTPLTELEIRRLSDAIIRAEPSVWFDLPRRASLPFPRSFALVRARAGIFAT